MSETTSGQSRLSARLKELRTNSLLGPLKQRQVADALGVSTPSLSSWENGTAVPSADRLRTYARLFATERSRSGDVVRLVNAGDLTPVEDAERRDLAQELLRLRDEAASGGSARADDRGELGGRFFYYPNEQSVTILYSALSPRQLGVARVGDDGRPVLDHEGNYLARPVTADDLPISQYATNPTHPNYVRHLTNGDIDALVELAAHIRAENPGVEVRWMPSSEIRYADELSSNVIILGGADVTADVVGFFIESVDLPVKGRVTPGGDEEFDLEFYWEAEDRSFKPVFAQEDDEMTLSLGARMLESDVARIARRPNPQNADASVTFLAGLFSRGTFGAVRAFTDANLRARNEKFIYDKLNPSDFWLLTKVPLFGNRTTLTPDIAGPKHILETS